MGVVRQDWQRRELEQRQQRKLPEHIAANRRAFRDRHFDSPRGEMLQRKRFQAWAGARR